MKSYGRKKYMLLRLFLQEVTLSFSTTSLSFAFFLFAIIATPLLIGFSSEVLSYFSLGLIWVCILFSFLSEPLLQDDYEDGTIEMYFCSNYSLQAILLTKLLSYWCLKVGGILCSLPLVSLLYHCESFFLFPIVVGSLLFTLLCAMHSCLTLGIKQHNLQSLTAFPTLLPCLCVCTSISENSAFFLLGYLLLFLYCVPIFLSLTLKSLLSQ